MRLSRFGQKGIATSSLLFFLDQIKDSLRIVRILKEPWEEIHRASDFDLLPGARTDLPATRMVVLEAYPLSLVKPWMTTTSDDILTPTL